MNGDMYFIPDSVTVGKFMLPDHNFATNSMVTSSVAECGFVTCRFKYDAWVSSSVFERLTKFKPSNQRDREAQLRKAVTDTVSELENSPTAGFKILGWHKNPYVLNSREYDGSGDVLMLDPRGFTFALKQDRFFETLRLSGCNMTDGVITGKFVYGWDSSDKTMTLVPVSHVDFAEWKRSSDAYREKRRTGPSVRAKDLVPGKVYRAAKTLDGDWMYVGVANTYSKDCHMAAFYNGGTYDVDRFVESEAGKLREKYGVKWPTTRGKMVFRSMKEREQQYVVRSDVSGIFSGEVIPDGGKYADAAGNAYAMRSGEPVTFDAVKAEMRKCPAFNRIKFVRNPVFSKLPQDVFEDEFGGKRGWCFETGFDPHVFVRSRDGEYVKASPTYSYSPKGSMYKIVNLSRRVSNSCSGMRKPFIWMPLSAGETYADMSVAQLYSAIGPSYPTYMLETGECLPAEYAIRFVPKNIRDAALGR